MQGSDGEGEEREGRGGGGERVAAEEKRKERERVVLDAKLSLVGVTVKFRGFASEIGEKLIWKLGKVTGYVEGAAMIRVMREGIVWNI